MITKTENANHVTVNSNAEGTRKKVEGNRLQNKVKASSMEQNFSGYCINGA